MAPIGGIVIHDQRDITHVSEAPFCEYYSLTLCTFCVSGAMVAGMAPSDCARHNALAERPNGANSSYE